VAAGPALERNVEPARIEAALNTARAPRGTSVVIDVPVG
jgi:hypothetical protein